MAVKEPLGRKAVHVLKSLRPDWLTRTPGVSAATAFIALVAVFVFAYSAWSPSVDTGERRTAKAVAQPEVARTGTPAATAARREAPARDGSRAADAGLQRAGSEREAAPAVVTLTGCLERSDKEFRLNDTSGTSAPKSRSWKSGFLTKRSASVAIVPASDELPLSSHVGQRITVTGTLVDREMRVRSLRRVSTSCESSPRARA